jgi:hypothetical protein
MSNKWLITIALSLSLLSGGAIGVENDELTSYTKDIKHNNGGGGRGEDTISLTAPETDNKSCAVFNSAKLEYNTRRYGDANITTQPILRCDPREEEDCTLGVSWQHAPAGGLDYKVKIGWALQAC